MKSLLNPSCGRVVLTSVSRRSIITVGLFVAILGLVVGCGTFRWGQRDDLSEVANTKERESHYWHGLKPDRDLQDPLWTP